MNWKIFEKIKFTMMENAREKPFIDWHNDNILVKQVDMSTPRLHSGMTSLRKTATIKNGHRHSTI